MYLTEQEIYSQYTALEKTCAYVTGQAEEIRRQYEKAGCGSITFIGCGSSYSLSKSAALSARLELGIPAYAFSAGDLLLNFNQYVSILKDTLLVSISRSGSTSEVLLLAEKAQAELGIPCFSICAKADSDLSKVAVLNLEIPWAFDESVCQTRCVSNLYAASLLFNAVLSGNEALPNALRSVIASGEAYMERYRPVLEQAARQDWRKVVVLADGELEGIAEEGALAFTEISMLPSHYYHFLDIRHGPIVLVDDKTLVIAALSPAETEHQYKLLADIKAQGAYLVAMCGESAQAPGADWTVTVPAQPAFAAQGLPFIYLCQALSLFKALELGGNPDAPTGLDPWIKL